MAEKSETSPEILENDEEESKDIKATTSTASEQELSGKEAVSAQDTYEVENDASNFNSTTAEQVATNSQGDSGVVSSGAEYLRSDINLSQMPLTGKTDDVCSSGGVKTTNKQILVSYKSCNEQLSNTSETSGQHRNQQTISIEIVNDVINELEKVLNDLCLETVENLFRQVDTEDTDSEDMSREMLNIVNAPISVDSDLSFQSNDNNLITASSVVALAVDKPTSSDDSKYKNLGKNKWTTSQEQTGPLAKRVRIKNMQCEEMFGDFKKTDGKTNFQLSSQSESATCPRDSDITAPNSSEGSLISADADKNSECSTDDTDQNEKISVRTLKARRKKKVCGNVFTRKAGDFRYLSSITLDSVSEICGDVASGNNGRVKESSKLNCNSIDGNITNNASESKPVQQESNRDSNHLTKVSSEKNHENYKTEVLGNSNGITENDCSNNIRDPIQNIADYRHQDAPMNKVPPKHQKSEELPSPKKEDFDMAVDKLLKKLSSAEKQGDGFPIFQTLDVNHHGCPLDMSVFSVSRSNNLTGNETSVSDESLMNNKRSADIEIKIDDADKANTNNIDSRLFHSPNLRTSNDRFSKKQDKREVKSHLEREPAGTIQFADAAVFDSGDYENVVIIDEMISKSDCSETCLKDTSDHFDEREGQRVNKCDVIENHMQDKERGDVPTLNSGDLERKRAMATCLSLFETIDSTSQSSNAPLNDRKSCDKNHECYTQESPRSQSPINKLSHEQDSSLDERPQHVTNEVSHPFDEDKSEDTFNIIDTPIISDDRQQESNPSKIASANEICEDAVDSGAHLSASEDRMINKEGDISSSQAADSNITKSD